MMTVDKSPAAMKEYLSRLHLEDILPEKIWSSVMIRHYLPGEYLCHAGEQVDYFWLIVEGRCKVVPSSEDGKTVVLSYMEPLDFNGDIEIFNDCGFLHSVQAEGNVGTIVIPRRVFWGEMMQSLPFLQLLCKTFAAKIYMSSQKHSSAMLYPIRSRLAHYIISQTEAMDSLVIILNTNETAQYLGITSRHMRRVLANLESEGLIHRRGYKITVKDMNKIREWSSYYY